MSNPVIKVENVSKTYRIIKDRSRSFYNKLSDFFKHILHTGNLQAANNYIKALDDVSFEVGEGEIVGIIGRNGSGKTTLLKLLARIIHPSSGVAYIRGRVGALLSLGIGFHPELSGRDNIYMNGIALGLKKNEINRVFDDIVTFAELSEFIDTPVKHYSTGMYMRLAFSVASHLNPDILLVDEVLAVGDAAFQRKCLGKMDEVSKGGRTVLFVSHNMSAIRRICQRVIFLDRGKKLMDGPTEEIISKYINSFLNNPEFRKPIWAEEYNPPELKNSFQIEKVAISHDDGSKSNIFTSEENIHIQIHYRVSKPFQSVRFTLHLKTVDDVLILSSTDADTLPVFGRRIEPGTYISECSIPANLLSPQIYFIDLWVHQSSNNIIAGVVNVSSFEVVETAGPLAPKINGIVNPKLRWKVKVI